MRPSPPPSLPPSFRETGGTNGNGETRSAEAALHLFLTVRQGANVVKEKNYDAKSTEQPSREDALDEARGDVLQKVEKDLKMR